MKHDPADETHRKPRRLRNTPLLKYIRLFSLAVTLTYAGAMYLAWKRKVLPYIEEQNKQYQTNEISEDESAMLHDYVAIPFLRSTIEKLIQRQEAKKAESKDTEAETDKA